MGLRIFYLRCFLLSCFIFMFQLIDYQCFRRLKHTTFMFHFWFQCFILKTLREKNKNTVGAIQKHCGSDSKTLRERESAPSVFWKMKHETKSETLKSYVSSSEITDIQLLYNKKWNMKDKSKVLKTYGYMWDKLQFVGLIGGRVCNPRQQQVLSIYL